MNEEFQKKVEARKAELAKSPNKESFEDVCARLDGMQEELYKIDIKRKKSKNEERDKLDRQYNELYELLEVEAQANMIVLDHIYPDSYYRRKRIKIFILAISIVIVIAVVIAWIKH